MGIGMFTLLGVFLIGIGVSIGIIKLINKPSTEVPYEEIQYILRLRDTHKAHGPKGYTILQDGQLLFSTSWLASAGQEPESW